MGLISPQPRQFSRLSKYPGPLEIRSFGHRLVVYAYQTTGNHLELRFDAGRCTYDQVSVVLSSPGSISS